jgi:hypothetical protein
MSQVVSHTATLRDQARHHWAIALAGLLALLATTAVVLVLAIDGGSSESVAQKAGPALRTDGGPEETGVAASVGNAQPDGSRAYVSESRVAAAITGH